MIWSGSSLTGGSVERKLRMNQYLKIIGEIISDASLVFFLGGAAVALVVGLWMIVNVSSLFKFNQYLGRWFSTRQMFRPMTAPIKSEPFIYHHHRIIGMLIVLASAYVLYNVAFQLESTAVQRLFLGSDYKNHSLGWVVDGLFWVLALGSLVALVVGIYLFIRPSLLKGVEVWGNKWMSTRRSTKVLEIMRTGPEPVIAAHPRIIGILIVLASVYIVVMLWPHWR